LWWRPGRIWAAVSWLTDRSSKQRRDATVHPPFSGVSFCFLFFHCQSASPFCIPCSALFLSLFFSVFFISLYPGSLCLTLITPPVFFLPSFPVSFPLKSPLFQTSLSSFLALSLSSLFFFFFNMKRPLSSLFFFFFNMKWCRFGKNTSFHLNKMAPKHVNFQISPQFVLCSFKSSKCNFDFNNQFNCIHANFNRRP